MENLSDILIIFGAKYLIFFVAGIAFLFLLKQPRNKQKQIVIFSIISLPLIYAAAKMSAIFYYNPRPFVSDNLISLIPHNPDNGFTSDHALLGGAIFSIIFYFNRKIGLLLFILTILVGVSRVVANIHHPIDIIGSVAIAFIVSFFVYRFLIRLNFYNRYSDQKPFRKRNLICKI